RKTKRSRSPAAARRRSRYVFFSAEQETTRPESAFERCSPILSSHGQRSSSCSGIPAAIFSTLDGGCSTSPSRKSKPSARARRSPIVVFPEPETPITMIRNLCPLLFTDDQNVGRSLTALH